jgi:hypothetical protein
MIRTETRSRLKKISALLAGSAIVLVGGILTSSTAHAKKGSSAAPQAPMIVSIETKTIKNRNRADVIVTVALPSNTPSKSIALTEVLVGTKNV